MNNLRTLGQIAALLPTVGAILLLRVFAPLLAAMYGPETVATMALRLLHRLDVQKGSW